MYIACGCASVVASKTMENPHQDNIQKQPRKKKKHQDSKGRTFAPSTEARQTLCVAGTECAHRLHSSNEMSWRCQTQRTQPHATLMDCTSFSTIIDPTTGTDIPVNTGDTAIACCRTGTTERTSTEGCSLPMEPTRFPPQRRHSCCQASFPAQHTNVSSTHTSIVLVPRSKTEFSRSRSSQTRSIPACLVQGR